MLDIGERKKRKIDKSGRVPPTPSSALSRLSAFFSCFTSFGCQPRVREVQERKTVPARRSPLSRGRSRSYPHILSLSLSLFLAGQRLMDIHSNEVKAINNSGGNAHPHLVPFLLKSSVCNKRPSHVNSLARSRARLLLA